MADHAAGLDPDLGKFDNNGERPDRSLEVGQGAGNQLVTSRTVDPEFAGGAL